MDIQLNCLATLRHLLDARPDLRQALESSITHAEIAEVRSLPQYYQFLEKILTEVPNQRTMSPATERYHYLVACSPGDLLRRDETFRKWLVSFSDEHGRFLDTAESVRNLASFTDDPEYRIEEYDRGPSGWRTFNQFFARRVKPGKRPIAQPCNNHIVVSACDSVYLGCWDINEEATVTAKGNHYPIMRLLEGSPFATAFAGGVFTHSYLDVNDYHRYHVPVTGIVRDSRVIPGDVMVDIVKNHDGSFTVKDDVGFQFHQTRGILVLESPLGMVGILPIGMGHVSSVNLTAEIGATLTKGEEFGYFCYGGSDIVLLFQAGKVKMTAEKGVHYKQGEPIGVAHPLPLISC